MLPKKLSNGICSLNAGVKRLALAIDILFDGKGNVIESKVFKSVIRVIPPSQAEDRIEDDTRKKLNCRTYYRRAEEQHRERIHDRQEEPDNAVESYAVYRTKRTVKESSVNKLSFGNTVVDNFYYPAYQAIDEEHKE